MCTPFVLKELNIGGDNAWPLALFSGVKGFFSDVTNTRNGEQGTANGERGTGNGERESGTKCTAATLLRIQNGGQNKRKGSKRNYLG